MNKKTKTIIKFIGMLILIYWGIFAMISWLKNIPNPPVLRIERWYRVKKNQINTILIVPLNEEVSPCALTVRTIITEQDIKIIDSLFNELQSNEDRGGHGGKWFARKQIKLVFGLNSGEKIAFCITFHNSSNVADYSEFNSSEDNFPLGGGFLKGRESKKLFEILMTIINKSGVEWVNAKSKCWDLGKTPVYKGCDPQMSRYCE